MTSSNKRRVLFLCTGNSARSQMAEALLKHRAGQDFEVFSAGTHPEEVDPQALKALANFGVDSQQLVSKSISDFAGQQFDYVITLCDKAGQECRSFAGAEKQMAWDFPDPKTRQGNQVFSTTLNEINNRLSMFLLVENKKRSSSSEDESLSISPVTFYKTLTDDIRLKTLMLTHYHGELCVCELMEALKQESQPKVSRNLAVLRKAQIIVDRKHGQWVFYRINPALPLWIKSVIAQTTENNVEDISEALERLAVMQDRPDKAAFCQ